MCFMFKEVLAEDVGSAHPAPLRVPWNYYYKELSELLVLVLLLNANTAQHLEQLLFLAIFTDVAHVWKISPSTAAKPENHQ